METKLSPWRRRLEAGIIFVGLLFFYLLVAPRCVKTRGGGGQPNMVPVGFVLWFCLSVLARQIVLLEWGLTPKRRRLLRLLYLAFTIPSAVIAISEPVPSDSDSRTECVRHLRNLCANKDWWALEVHAGTGARVRWEDLAGPNKFLKSIPECPAGGVYTLGKVGEPVRCSLESKGHVLSVLY